MKIGVLSDIHGNIEALMKVEKELLRQKVDYLFVLGDQLGYYYEAIEVFKLIDKWPNTTIMGNHERIFLQCYENENMSFLESITQKYGGSFEFYIKMFDDRLIDKIKNLPSQKLLEIDGVKFNLCHGSPMEMDEYLYPTMSKDEFESIFDNDYDVIFNGHTHYPMVYYSNNKILINAGSIGQSRTIGGIAQWGIFNTENNVYTPQSTPYDVDKLKKRLKGYNENNEYLYHVLTRNN